MRYWSWVQVVIAALAMVATLPGRTHGLGLITVPLMRDLQLEETHYATLNLWATLLGAAFCVPWGWLLDKLGTRLVLNEFVAFLELGPLKGHIDQRSFVIATYALCGFANLSSIAIQIGGIGALAPTRKSDLARLGVRAVAAGSMANFMSACIAGMLL